MDAEGELIGRSRELRAVTAVLDAPGSTAVVVEGEAGMGKTTLLDALAGAARERSFTVMACHPAESEAALSFGALADLFSGVEPHVLRGLPAPQRRAFDAVRLHADPSSDELGQRAVGTALCSALQGVAARTRVLVVVDDAQWLDRPSEQALRFAVRRLRRLEVSFVVSVRSDGAAVDPLGLEAALPGAVRRVVVEGMSLGALRELVSVRLGVVVARPVLVRLAEATAGNPFYVLELARALAGKGLLDDSTLAFPLPERLHDLVADRIGSLDPPTARACLAVAAPAHPTVDLVLAATGSPTWAGSGAAAAEDAGIITIDRARVRFTHPLLRSAVYESARPSVRRAIHARLAEVIDEPEERARHLAASVPGASATVAEALDLGARHAWHRGAREVAAELAERALAATPSAQGRNRRRLAAAEFQFEVANPTRSRTLLQEVLDDDPTRAERLEALFRLGSGRFFVAGFEECVEVLTGVLGELDEHEHALRARVELEVTLLLTFGGDSRAAVEHGELAVVAARAAGDTALERDAASPLALASLWAGEGVRTDMVELSLAGARPIDPCVTDPHVLAGAVLKWGDCLDRARSVLVARYEQAQAQGAVVKLPILAWHIADIEVLAGRLDAAEPLAEDALEGARYREGMAYALCSSLRARVHALKGRLDVARADVEMATAAAKEVGGIAVMAADEAAVFVEACADDPAAVHAIAGPLVADLDQIPSTDPAFLRWVADEVEALAALGKTAPAAELLDWFEERCRRTERRSGWAAAHRCRAVLSSHEGALDTALDHIRASVELYEQVGMRFERARSLLVAGGIHRRRRQKAAATEVLREARAILDDVGASRWADRATDELDRLGHRRGDDTGSDELTAVEVRVARLVAGGLRNREVAAKLFMSPKTVEVHLTRIYRKLGIRSRTQLGAVLARSSERVGGDGGGAGRRGRGDVAGREGGGRPTGPNP